MSIYTEILEELHVTVVRIWHTFVLWDGLAMQKCILYWFLWVMTSHAVTLYVWIVPTLILLLKLSEITPLLNSSYTACMRNNWMGMNQGAVVHAITWVVPQCAMIHVSRSNHSYCNDLIIRDSHFRSTYISIIYRFHICLRRNCLKLNAHTSMEVQWH